MSEETCLLQEPSIDDLCDQYLAQCKARDCVIEERSVTIYTDPPITLSPLEVCDLIKKKKQGYEEVCERVRQSLGYETQDSSIQYFTLH